MHKIAAKEFVCGDFSLDMLMLGNAVDTDGNICEQNLKAHYKHFMNIIDSLNNLRDLYLKTKDKKYWRCMIEMLPSSYNQKRTVMMSYEVLANIYKSRKNHKLDEWSDQNDFGFCTWIHSLPYSELITGNYPDVK